MKAITIWQPWASLLACGEKKFETRSWATYYRGPIAIHAAAPSIRRVLKKYFPLGAWDYHPDHQAQAEFLNALSKAFGVSDGDIIGYLEKLPTKAVIATANLIGCHKIDKIQKIKWALPETVCWDCNRPGTWIDVTDQEKLFGNWTPGRYAWEITNVKMIKPILATGHQGLWTWDGEPKE